jgi:hypothetical protein
MANYSVVTYARKEGAIGALGTERRVYIVQANSEAEARQAAIAAAYQEGGLEHIQPTGRVTQVSDFIVKGI